MGVVVVYSLVYLWQCFYIVTAVKFPDISCFFQTSGHSVSNFFTVHSTTNSTENILLLFWVTAATLYTVQEKQKMSGNLTATEQQYKNLDSSSLLSIPLWSLSRFKYWPYTRRADGAENQFDSWTSFGRSSSLSYKLHKIIHQQTWNNCTCTYKTSIEI